MTKPATAADALDDAVVALEARDALAGITAAARAREVVIRKLGWSKMAVRAFPIWSGQKVRHLEGGFT